MPQQSDLLPVLRDIHAWWFGPLADKTSRNAEKTDIWFKRSDETDAHIGDNWGQYLKPAREIDWDLDALSREEQIALIILLDQFPRNIFRESGEAFAYDAKALAIAKALIARGPERFYLVEQVFLCLPLEHSENVADQDLSVLHYAQMTIDAPDDWKDYRRMALDYATKHRDLIRKFGRYPHRNAMLGRESTEEEVKFIEEHGRGF